MRKLVIACIIAVIAAAIPAYAETIRDFEFDIPEEWELALSEDEDDYSMRYYVNEPEVVTFVVQDISPVGADMASIYLMTSSSLYGESEGFLQMQQMSTSINGSTASFEECVYKDDNGWEYGIVFSRNVGSNIISMIYTRPTMDSTYMLDKYLDICSSYFPEA